ncbi:MAG: molybdopterin-dependent oxidoreductase [Pseudomonadota bacterium]
MKPIKTKDKTVLRALGLGGYFGGGAEGMVDVKDGKIVRVRPMRYGWKYKKEEIRQWKIERDGKSIEPSWQSLPGPFSLAYKKRVYSPNRIQYPIKRVDWDPNGERNPQNRGKSKYVRISWDEASQIIANEIKRIHATYGVHAILLQADGHGECKTINTPHGHPGVLLDRMGGFTLQVRNPDSWEGWYWGAKHVWGQGAQGIMYPAANIVKDTSEHADMVLFWGCDPETTPWGFTGQFASRLCYFWGEIGIKQVYICPDLNYGAAVHADKWIPVLPNTDAALQLSIIYMWLTEGTYDKAYVETHTVGMDQVADYVLGKEDGVPKSPEWASKKCGVPEWTIKALAREFAAKTTSIAHYFGGGFVRGAFSHESGRLECILLGMQGLGGPGVHQHQLTYFGMPRAEGLGGTFFWNPEIEERLSLPVMSSVTAWQQQIIPKTLIQQAITSDEPIVFHGTGAQNALVLDQFEKYTFPIPKEKGGSELHMIWTDSPCRITCWNEGNSTELAMRNPKIETIVAQHPWLENDCIYADIILPANTYMEVDDILTNIRQGTQQPNIMLAEKAIEPIGESKSDFEIVLEVGKKLGMAEILTEGMTIADLQKKVWEYMGGEKLVTWEQLKEKKYWIYNTASDWADDPPGFRRFYEDPVKFPLSTPTGKLEFYSESLAKAFPDDRERSPIPKWVEKSHLHDERLSSGRAKMFPLLLMSNHGRWRVHAQCDDITWTREAPTCKILGPDGYKYEPVWMHPSVAESRGIRHGDIVKIFNERGIVLAGAYVTERLRPGVVYIDHGARHDPIKTGEIERGGAINTISPLAITSENCVGQATSGYLVQVERLKGEEMDRWRRAYPEAFERKYDPAAGLRFDAWIVDGGE